MKTVYCSFDGRYSDNPRALYEGRSRRRSADEHVWLVDPGYVDGFPAEATKVRYGSAESVEALESADLVVANTHLELEWTKKPGAVYLQTWHGTPLKRIHHDSLWAPPGMLDALDRDVARWDYLLSPNAASTERLRRAFAFRGEMLEIGYPRNDVLSSPRRDVIRARVRGQLGLGEDTVAVLYAPTWRDDEFYADGHSGARLALDIDAFQRELGPGHCLLTRLHHKMTDRAPDVRGSGVRDVSRHPDVHELYLAADVLVTDYSSVMFDFAVTGKPIVYFAYDFAAYRDSIRGFYFDLEPVAPGPLLQTTAEVVEALQSLEEIRRIYAERYSRFRSRYCHLADGEATSRLLKLTEPAVTGAGRVAALS